MADGHEEVWITGIGLVSSLGAGSEEHWSRMTNGAAREPVVDAASFAPYPVHPLAEIDFTGQIPGRGDLRQMGPWQRLGVYAAGLALSNAGIAGKPDLLGRTDMIVAANGGERDTDVDETLSTQLRPTLFLAQLPNLMAGNISIVHKVTGSSRTFMGEEMAGVSAAQTAVRKIRGQQSQLCLIGGAYNAEREDMQLLFECGRYLWPHAFKPLWERHEEGGGIITGSVGAFLVLEAREHARARGARPYARIHDVLADRCGRKAGEAAENAMGQLARLRDRIEVGPLPVLSGASGAEPVTSEECWFLGRLGEEGFEVAARAIGSVLGHSVEAQFPAGLALAAIAASKGEMFPPFAGSDFEKPCDVPPDRILVTGWGHWRGEGLALVEAVEDRPAANGGAS
jgi:3-oxoacyl-[acyl-carrier-protein] synthase II